MAQLPAPFALRSILRGQTVRPFAEEVQQFTFSGDSNSRSIDCEFIVRGGQRPVKFGDTKEGTFALRLAPELDAPTGTMVNSEGAKGKRRYGAGVPTG